MVEEPSGIRNTEDRNRENRKIGTLVHVEKRDSDYHHLQGREMAGDLTQCFFNDKLYRLSQTCKL